MVGHTPAATFAEPLFEVLQVMSSPRTALHQEVSMGRSRHPRSARWAAATAWTAKIIAGPHQTPV